MEKREWKRRLKKLWWFIWEDDSIWSWLVNIILAFVLIKFVVYPVLGLLLQTGFPIVAVVSGSMEHDGNFDNWWLSSTASCDGRGCSQEEFYSNIGISKEEFKDFRFKNGFNKGDIMVLYGTKPKDLKIGDVLVFISSRKSPRPDPIIHRIVVLEDSDSSLIATTKGDHNNGIISSCDSRGRNCIHEDDISEEQMLGKAVIRIPYLGWIKIWFVELTSLI